MNSIRLPLFGLLALALLGLLAMVLFSGGKDESSAPEGNRRTASTDSRADPRGVNAATFTPVTPNPPAPGGILPAANAVVSGPQQEAKTPLQPSEPEPQIHVVEAGDALEKIARKYGCKVKDIYALNPGLNDETARRIRPGQKIIVKGKAPAESPLVDNGAAPKQEKVSLETPDVPAPKGDNAREHTLKQGDTIFALAKQYYGTPAEWRLIREANPSWDPINFEPGTTIVIPPLPGTVRKNKPEAPGDAVVDGSSVIPPRR